jgi:type II secretory pathway pseudopilin PulG
LRLCASYFFPSESGLFPIFRRLAARPIGNPPKFRAERRIDIDNDGPAAIKNRVIVSAPTWFLVVLCSLMMSKIAWSKFPECDTPPGRPPGNVNPVSGHLTCQRRAFTRTELVAVLGIIVVLAGIVAIMTGRLRHGSVVEQQKADFQTIAAGLQAYKQDFGDYPRNIELPKWNTQDSAVPAPIYLTLASALLGPGPALTQEINGNANYLELGDGNDGPGFRCQAANVIPGDAGITPGSNQVTFKVDAAFAAKAGAIPTPASLILLPIAGNPAQPYSETIGIQAVSGSGLSLQITLTAPPLYSHIRANISGVQDKVWGPYISAQAFNVAFIPSAPTGQGGSALPALAGYGQPVLLDRWGQVIQYFPRYGPANNRTNDSTYAVNAAVQAGPLFGYSQPRSVDGTNGQNAIWDWRDGATFFSVSSSNIAWNAPNPVTGNLDYAKPWPNPTQTMGSDFRPELAIQWMLGEPDPAGNFNNEILAGEKLSYDGPYILISAGPGGPERSNGGFCSMVDPNNYDNPLPENKLQQAFIDSGNIYNFDRP